MGIRAIEYRPWKGDRTDPNQRWLVISKHVFQKNVRAKAVIVILILGMMLAHAFPIIGAVLFPHEEITNEDMIGSGDRITSEPEPEWEVVEGELNVTGNLQVNGTFKIEGELDISGSLRLDDGSVVGIGMFSGWGGDSAMTGAVFAYPAVVVQGNVMFGNLSQLLPEDIPGGLPGGPPGEPPGDEPLDPDLIFFMLLTSLENATQVSGNGTISGYGHISGNGTIEGDYEKEDIIDFTGGEGYFNAIIIIFTMLLAAIICADVISADLANSSFVLYFSRPVRAFDYLLGKIIGLTWVMWIFCLIPPAVYVLVMMGTQTGDDFSGGFKILGKTLLVGLVTSFYFLPYGLMISSLTKSKAYAGIGIFMSFFVLLIISGIFSQDSDKWSLISPVELLINFYKITFNGSIPDGITSGQVGGAILAFTVIPMAIVIYWIYRKGAGK